jgi:simple sugar transport system ATP-binding protein
LTPPTRAGSGEKSTGTPAISGTAITKAYGPVTALDSVDFEAHNGRVLALLGDNGAGKTTLIKILNGVIKPDSGSVMLDGKPVKFRNASDARRNGIATVFQDLAVCELLSITRNIVLGNEPTRGLGPLRLYDARAADRIARQALDALGAHIDRDLSSYARTLSGGERQALAIARAMYYGSKCLILDEPTAALAARQAQGALNHVRAAADSGQAVILISHNYAQALAVADDVLILAHGRVVRYLLARDASVEDVMNLVSA